MNDSDIIAHIGELVDEEHRLERAHHDEPLTEVDAARRREIEVQLDQCWDLLNQRRARRDYGRNPDDAELRTESTVESYRQ